MTNTKPEAVDGDMSARDHAPSAGGSDLATPGSDSTLEHTRDGEQS